jgi:hypothetical protein
MNKPRSFSQQAWIQTIQIVGLALGAVVGAKFPDVDLRVPFLVHRSIVTHGILLSGIGFLIQWERPQLWLRTLLIGFSATVAVHLGFDLFPRGWGGPALIFIPFYGRTSPTFSWFWMFGSMIGCLVLTGRMLRTLVEIVFSLFSIVGAYLYFANTEPFFWPGVFVLAAVGIGWWRNSHLALIVDRDWNEVTKRF